MEPRIPMVVEGFTRDIPLYMEISISSANPVRAL